MLVSVVLRSNHVIFDLALNPLELVELIDDNSIVRLSVNLFPVGLLFVVFLHHLAPSATDEGGFLSFSQWSLLVLLNSRFHCIWDESMHEIEFDNVKSDENRQIQHVVVGAS